MKGWDSVVGTATELQAALQSNCVLILGKRNKILFTKAYTNAVWHIHLTIQWLPRNRSTE